MCLTVLAVKVAAFTDGVIHGVFILKMKTTTIMAFMMAAVPLGAGMLVGPKTAAAQNSVAQPRPTTAESHGQTPPPVRSAAQANDPLARRVDGVGDPLPANALARLGTHRFRSTAQVDQVAVEPGGKHLFVQLATSVILVDAVTGRAIQRFEPPRWRQGSEGQAFSVRIESFAISPDGKLLAAGTGDMSKLDCPILLFDLATGRKIGELSGHASDGDSANASLVFATPTRLLSAGADKTVRVWDVTTQKEINRSRTPPESSVSELAVSADGKRVFGVCSRQKSCFWAVWDVETAKFVHGGSKVPGQFARLALSPDAQTLALAVGLGEVQQDGGSNEVRIYSVSDRKEVRRWKTHAGRFPDRNAVAFSPDGRTIATGGADQKVRRWDLATTKENGLPIEPGYEANNVGYLDATTLFTFGAQHAVRFWDAATGRPKLRFVGPESCLTAAAYAPDGRHVATGGGGGDATLRIWDATTGKQVAHLRADALFDVTSVRFSPDGKRIVSSDSDGVARLWDWARGKEIRAFRSHKPWLHSGVLSPDGNKLATGDNRGVVHVWDVTSGKPVHTLRGHTARVTSLVFSTDGRALFSGGRNSIRQWDLATGKEVGVIKLKPIGVTSLALSPDGRRLFSGSGDHKICVWEVSSARLSRILEGPSNTITLTGVRAIALSPDGRQLAAAGEEGAEEGCVYIWDVLTGDKIACLAGHSGAVTALSYSPNGERLVSCSVDTTAIVWSVTGLKMGRPKLDATTIAGIWHDLTDPDAEKGYAAICRLVAGGDVAVSALDGKVAPAAPADLSKVPALIKQLGDTEFLRRTQAHQSLRMLGISVEPLLRKTIASAPTLEVMRTLEKILAELSADQRRHERAIEVLEMIGTTSARILLAELARGDPNAKLTRHASDAIARLERRR